MTNKILFILVGLFIAAGIFASESDLTGRDIVDRGLLRTMEGTFEIEDTEWYLRTEEQFYIVHKGLDWYTEEIGFPLPEGRQVKIEGFVFEDEISPCTITIENTRYAFRSKEGYPLWGGQGNRSNERYPDDN